MEKSYLIRIWNKDIITRNTKSIKNLLLTKQCRQGKINLKVNYSELILRR